MSLVGLVIDVHHQLDSAGFPHAFGGALALAYLAEPRGTIDVDVNVFAPVTEIDAVLDVFVALGLRPEQSREDSDLRKPLIGSPLTSSGVPGMDGESS